MTDRRYIEESFPVKFVTFVVELRHSWGADSLFSSFRRPGEGSTLETGGFL
jgi:hypothetical protein